MCIVVKKARNLMVLAGKRRLLLAVEITNGINAKPIFQDLLLMNHLLTTLVQFISKRKKLGLIHLPIVTYLYHCNTDITSLSSGTAIKAVVLYVSDYITKSTLKTHTIFESIKSVFTKVVK